MTSIINQKIPKVKEKIPVVWNCLSCMSFKPRKDKPKVRSTKTTLKFSNFNKLRQLKDFVNEYRDVVSQFVDILWEMDKIPKLLEKDITSQVKTWLSARATQSAGKQASGIIRGSRRKQEKRLFIINKLLSEGKPRKAKKLQKIYDEVKVSKPNIENVEPELDSRFVKLDTENKTSFDGWITLTSLGNGLKIVIPFKKSSHFNKLLSKGQLRPGVRLSKSNLTFMIEIPKKTKVTTGNTLGIDIGQTTLISCSDGYTSKKDKHNHDLTSISKKISSRKKGSKAFLRAVSHRKNYINWSINQLNLENVKQINLENIKNLRKGRKSSRILSHWTYTEIFGKLESYCDDFGVQIVKINPTFTSQRCSVCGWTRKSNRKGKSFKCGKCEYISDADLNASKNIALDLPGISKKKRLERPNKIGFYWNVLEQEPIVPVVQKLAGHICPQN